MIAAFSCPRVKQVLAVMREGMPNTHIVLLGLLPRDIILGSGAFEWPNRMSRAIALANYDYKVSCAQEPSVGNSSWHKCLCLSRPLNDATNCSPCCVRVHVHDDELLIENAKLLSSSANTRSLS